MISMSKGKDLKSRLHESDIGKIENPYETRENKILTGLGKIGKYLAYPFLIGSLLFGNPRALDAQVYPTSIPLLETFSPTSLRLPSTLSLRAIAAPSRCLLRLSPGLLRHFVSRNDYKCFEEGYNQETPSVKVEKAVPPDSLFQEGEEYVFDEGPSYVYIDDLNQDGYSDLVVRTRDIVILLNNGDGTFHRKASFPGPDAAITGGDFDGDRDIDLAIINWRSADFFSTFFNNGDGSFSTGREYDTEKWSLGIISYDLDGDGDVDLAVGGERILVFLNDGNGDFSDKRVVISEWIWQEVFIYLSGADLDNDGDIDLVTVPYNFGPFFGGVEIGVFLNQGDGTFSEPVSYIGPQDPYILLADFDADGDTDVLAMNQRDEDSPSHENNWRRIELYPNRGDGTLSEEPIRTAVDEILPLFGQAVDVDLDGDVDLIATVRSRGDPTKFYIFPNKGDGTFSDPVSYYMGLRCYFVNVGDLDRDGDVDIVASDNDKNILKIFWNRTIESIRTGIEGRGSRGEDDYIPQAYTLCQNYPNPFNPTTTIRFELPHATTVNLIIYNTLGQVVRTLVDERRAQGAYQVQWNGKDTDGLDVASGIYLYRLKAGEDVVQTRRMLLLR